ncbi:flagellar regulatory protein FleQ [Vibrio astriarenae]|nr:flagellar regulatory protein FleQ [Vibrio sp. C7]
MLQLAHRAAQTDATVLITGESGTGKEVLAKYVHQHSPRKDAPFVAINCAAIPESMLEAVLFGHVKGAFTGATTSQAGKFEEADGGTLLLDEIGEMPLAVQAKLLRVLQERQVERIGSHKAIELDIRIIAATNVDLQQAVSERRFRQDLYYRLDVLPLQWPPLRERKEDILPLAEHFIAKYNRGCNETCRLTAEAQQALVSYDWVGNIRELETLFNAPW